MYEKKGTRKRYKKKGQQLNLTAYLTGGTQGRCCESKQQTSLISLVPFCDDGSSETLNFWSRRAISPCRTWGISSVDDDDVSLVADSFCCFAGDGRFLSQNELLNNLISIYLRLRIYLISGPKSASRHGRNERCNVWFPIGLCKLALTASSSGLFIYTRINNTLAERRAMTFILRLTGCSFKLPMRPPVGGQEYVLKSIFSRAISHFNKVSSGIRRLGLHRISSNLFIFNNFSSATSLFALTKMFWISSQF